MTSLIRRLLLPPIAAATLVLGVAGTAFAGTPQGTVSVFNEDDTPAGDTVCAFYVVFNPVAGGESGSWALHDASTAIVEQGDYSVTGTDGDREPDSGTFSLPNGTYKLVWDSETPIDESNQHIQIVVSCAANPSPSFEESVAAETSKPTHKPGGGIGNVGVPTLPNTSAGEQATAGPSPLAALLMPALCGLLALIVVLTPRRGLRRR